MSYETLLQLSLTPSKVVWPRRRPSGVPADVGVVWTTVVVVGAITELVAVAEGAEDGHGTGVFSGSAARRPPGLAEPPGDVREVAEGGGLHHGQGEDQGHRLEREVAVRPG